MGDFFISPEELKSLVGGPHGPMIFDVRRKNAFDADSRILPAARWRDHMAAEEWGREIPPDGRPVVYCAHGHNVSQLAASVLRQFGRPARVLEGGIEAWQDAGGLVLEKSGLPGSDWRGATRWVTRIRPKIDRIACPWLVLCFIDPSAKFYFVTPDQVAAAAQEMNAIPFDIEGVDFSHEGERCSFDIFLDRFGIEDEALRDIALIVRGADTARLDLSPQASGLLAMSFGLSALSDGEDHSQLDRGLFLYDCLYAWRRSAASETHNWPAKAA
jgi:rhodanese-related sulfurtransferase